MASLGSYRLWEPKGGTPQEPFVLSSKENESSLYEVDIIVESVRYRYGFVISARRVEEEWLHAWPHGRMAASRRGSSVRATNSNLISICTGKRLLIGKGFVRKEAHSEGISGKATISFSHKTQFKRGVWLPLDWESSGTITLLGIATRLVTILRKGGLLCIDELEASLHPMLALEILRLFNDPVHNLRGAQLMFTTHDTNLLGNVLGEPPLRRDQIWFTKKIRPARPSFTRSRTSTREKRKILNAATFKVAMVRSRSSANSCQIRASRRAADVVSRRSQDDRPIGRRGPSREPKLRILIVCEGKETEPGYFKAFQHEVRNPRVHIEIGGETGVPLTVVQVAIRLRDQAEREAARQRDENLKLDEVWAVFDVDEHPNLDQARQLADSNAIKLAPPRTDARSNKAPPPAPRPHEASCSRCARRRAATPALPAYAPAQEGYPAHAAAKAAEARRSPPP